MMSETEALTFQVSTAVQHLSLIRTQVVASVKILSQVVPKVWGGPLCGDMALLQRGARGLGISVMNTFH